MKRVTFQLSEGIGGFPNGPLIKASGGTCYVATADDAAKATLFDSTGASLANPISLTQGKGEFFVGDTIETVDLYILAPGGQFVTKAGVRGQNDIGVDTHQRNQVAVIPFAIGDTTAATETDTGFNEPANALVTTAAVRISTVDAAITIDVGTDSGDSGDADGFLDGVSTAALGVVPGTLADGAATLGVLLSTDESAGDLVPEPHVSGGKSITYTLLTAADTAEGFILLPYTLMG